VVLRKAIITSRLHAAVFDGNLNLVKQLLGDGGDATAMVPAFPLEANSSDVRIEQRKLLSVLIKAGADIDYVDWNAEEPSTLLYRATTFKRHDLIEILHQAGADLDKICWRGQTALHGAMAIGRWDIARMLVRMGADID